MYTFDLSEKYLSSPERDVFENYLVQNGLDDGIWEVFASLFNSGTKYTQPLLLRVYKDDELYGAAIIIKCRQYGQALFNNRLLAKTIDLVKIPFYLWIKFGCCMDMMSNPGFVKDPEKTDEVHRAMANYLEENSLLSIINDYSVNHNLFENASILPALPHAIIDNSSMKSIEDYTSDFKNIKRKIRVFKNKGGEYNQINSQLSLEQTNSLKHCFLSTSEKSIFYLPYQDLYLNAAINTSRSKLDNVYYFIATLNGEFLGYQAALKTGDNLNALHGAFNRELKTTYHAYDILFVKMTEFAIENELKLIDFGAVLNLTKQKMINKSIDLSYFVFSKYSFIQQIITFLLKLTKIQSAEQLKFRE